MKTRVVKIGNTAIGGGMPVAVQSMTNTDTKDAVKTIAQIASLEKAGCEIVRCAVPDVESAAALRKIKDAISIPLVADIHFDAQAAIAAIENGADKIRINPGNIGNREKIIAVVEAAKAAHIPIRVGANAGSLAKDVLSKYGGPTSDAVSYTHLDVYKRQIADRALYMQSVYMQSIVEKWANIDFAVISAGAPPNYYENNMQVPLDRMIDMINENYGKPVGDICAFRINIKGEFVNNDYNSRIIGIGEEYLKKAGKVMGIIAGEYRALSAIGVLNTGLLNYLVIDERTAQRVLEILDRKLIHCLQ